MNKYKQVRSTNSRRGANEQEDDPTAYSTFLWIIRLRYESGAWMAPLADSARAGWIIQHMGADFHDEK